METFKVTKLEIGFPHQGGIIFYLDETGEHGLIASPYDQKKTKWGSAFGVEVTQGRFGIGMGKENTKIIIAKNLTTETAAHICAKARIGGHDDWFLPSFDELQLMLTNLYEKQFAKFPDVRLDYWSSTDADGFRAVGLNFFNNEKKTYWQTEELLVRPIREF